MFKKLKLKKRKEKKGGWGNSTELQKPNVEAEVYNTKKCFFYVTEGKKSSKV